MWRVWVIFQDRQVSNTLDFNAAKAVFLMGTEILNYVAQVTYNLYIMFLKHTILVSLWMGNSTGGFSILMLGRWIKHAVREVLALRRQQTQQPLQPYNTSILPQPTHTWMHAWPDDKLREKIVEIFKRMRVRDGERDWLSLISKGGLGAVIAIHSILYKSYIIISLLF
jgi:hypothetical protein